MSERLEALLARLVALAPSGVRLGLDRVEEALGELGAPHRGLAVVHVAGTNGKGSTSALVEAMGLAAGYRVGLTTSPHLCRFSERIRIGGAPISDEAFVYSLESALSVRTPLTFFECLTIAAFHAFAEAQVELAVVEVGLGGRLDATNVVPAPLATAITSIGFDHEDRLGSTLAAIAGEKAGICKPGSPLVLGPLPAEALEVARQRARAVGAGPVLSIEAPEQIACGEASHPVSVRSLGAGRVRVALPALPWAAARELEVALPLRGPHQRHNLGVALGLAHAASRSLPGLLDAAAVGVPRVSWPGRFERLSWPSRAMDDGERRPSDHGAAEPVPVWIDGAHNPEGARALAHTLTEEGMKRRSLGMVFGAMAD